MSDVPQRTVLRRILARIPVTAPAFAHLIGAGEQWVHDLADGTEPTPDWVQERSKTDKIRGKSLTHRAKRLLRDQPKTIVITGDFAD